MGGGRPPAACEDRSKNGSNALRIIENREVLLRGKKGKVETQISPV